MVTALVGGSFGSEGKGLIAAHVASQYDVHVRVGAANAGHTFYTGDEKHVVQQIPCAAYANPYADIVIGAGAMIDVQKLAKEVVDNAEWRTKRGCHPLNLFIDQQAHVVTNQHRLREQRTDLAERIGSTSTIAKEGIGAAQAAKVLREESCVQASPKVESVKAAAASIEAMLETSAVRPRFIDTVEFLDVMRRSGSSILLEGTQGTGLSLNHGFFPYTTSRETTAAGLAADCGIAPRNIDDVIGVFRTYPIRVAGNSGPFFPDSVETSFEKIGVQPEKTTVTKLQRRIATFSFEQVRHAARLNGFTRLALTFCDYMQPNLFGLADADLGGKLQGFLSLVEDAADAPIAWLGTGPSSVIERSPDIVLA